MPASRVAAVLTKEGVPTPDAERTRKDNGIRHTTSGVWHGTTIVNIARNPLLGAIVAYGRRSMGDQLRFEGSGPRGLTGSDFRADGKPKVIRNHDNQILTAAAKFDPLVDSARHEALLKILDKRGGTQRGKARSRDPNRNPLGGRIVDLNCCWPMYRIPKSDSYQYRCGAYTQSHGAICDHNVVDGDQRRARRIAAEAALAVGNAKTDSPVASIGGPRTDCRFSDAVEQGERNGIAPS